MQNLTHGKDLHVYYLFSTTRKGPQVRHFVFYLIFMVLFFYKVLDGSKDAMDNDNPMHCTSIDVV